MVLAEKIRDLIADKKQPYAVIQTFKNSSWPSETRICEKTLYNYITDNVIHGISIRNLSNKGKKYNGNKRKPKFSRIGCAMGSISNRPDCINNRSEAERREISTVKSCASSTFECALTQTERKTRAGIIRKMPNAKGRSVVEG